MLATNDDSKLSIDEAIEAAMLAHGDDGEEEDYRPKPEEDETEELEDDDVVEEEEAPVEQQAGPPIDAPHFWKSEHKEIFKKLPRDAQESIAQYEQLRNNDHYRKTQAIQQKERLYGELDQIFDRERVEKYGRFGATPASVVRIWASWQDRFERDRHKAALEYLQTWNIRPEELIQQQGQQSPESQTIRQLNQQIGQLGQRLERYETNYVEQDYSSKLGKVQAILSEKDGNGNPLRPYAKVLEPHIAQRAADIRKHYPDVSIEEGVRLAYNDVVEWAQREGAIPQQTYSNSAPSPDDDIEEINEEAEKSERASRSVRGTIAKRGARKPKDIDDAIRMAEEMLS